MNSRPRRRVERIRLATPLSGRLGAHSVRIIDISLTGCRIEHSGRIAAGTRSALGFVWNGERSEIPCRVLRCRLDRFPSGGGETIYQSGVEFEGENPFAIRSIIEYHIARALEAQRANARGIWAPSGTAIDYVMPLLSHGDDGKSPSADAPRQFIRLSLDKNQWKRIRTDKPEQPEEGFTVLASEDLTQVEKLRQTYEKGDRATRNLIRLCAQVSISTENSVPEQRFRP